MKLDSSGTEVWNAGDRGEVQLNDLELASDGLVAIGHKYTNTEKGCWFKGCISIDGYAVKLDANGDQEWDNTYGNFPGGVNQFADIESGNDVLINNECWGVAPSYADDGTTHDGYVMTCGTGIEYCDFLGWPFGVFGIFTWMECLKDPRKIWRSLTVAFDLEGERVWSRMDNF